MGNEEDKLENGMNSDEQTFKSTEIYKSKSRRDKNVFKKEKSRKEKLLEWAKSHKKRCALIVVGVMVVLVAIVVLIVYLVKTKTQEAENVGENVGVETEAEQEIKTPDIEIVPDENGSGSYLGAVYEVMEYYGEDLNSATEFIGLAVDEALAAGDTAKAADILMSEARQLSLNERYERANKVLRSIDLSQFTARERTEIAIVGMSVAKNLEGGEESDEYEYWSSVYSENIEEVPGYGG